MAAGRHLAPDRRGARRHHRNAAQPGPGTADREAGEAQKETGPAKLRGRHKSLPPTEWVPGEGGPLQPSPLNPVQTAEEARMREFGVAVPMDAAGRSQELVRKLMVVLDSPLGEGVARIVEESYRMLSTVPSSR